MSPRGRKPGSINKSDKAASTKAVEKITKEKITKQEVQSEAGTVETFTVSITETVPTGEYANKKFMLSRTVTVKKNAEKEIDEVAEKLNNKLAEIVEKFTPESDDDEDYDLEDSDDEEESDEEEESDGPTEEDIRKMKKAELTELIETEELDIDPDDYKKIGDLREAVIAEMFEESEDDSEDEDDDDWEDDEDDE